jgi:hypothetical protein
MIEATGEAIRQWLPVCVLIGCALLIVGAAAATGGGDK